MAPRNAIFRRLFACVSSPASSTRESVEQYAEKPAPHSPAAEVDDYDGRLELIRRREYPQLYNASSQLATVFLDNTGSTLYAASHIRAQAEEMLTVMPANPHSHHTGSKWAHDKIEQARDRLLGFFGASSRDYALVFTANATAAIRLAGELVPLSKESTYCYTSAAHTSVVGLRSIASEWGATVRAADFDDLDDIIQPEATTGVSLVAYPAQCNFSGQRFPWDIADKVASRFPTTADSDKHSEGHAPWWVLVDAASYAASSPLNLGALRTGPDFVAVSMYKIFGAPTGVGALLVRRSSVPFLKRKRFFGGGTVTVLSFDHMWQEFRDEVEARLEDGTVDFQAIISLHHALDAHARNFGSMTRVKQHTASVTRYAVSTLNGLCHGNGHPLCKVYGHDGADFGPTVALNLVDANGEFIGYVEVERLAVMAGIAMRTGRFCNPGAARRWLDLTTSDMIRYASLGFACGDDHDIIDGKPVGAMRISFGAMTARQDIDAFASFLVRHFYNYTCVSENSAKVDKDVSSSAEASIVATADASFALPRVQVQVDQVVVYPVKSCHGWCVPHDMPWEITRSGLKYDRSFVIMRENSSIPMQQKRYPRMALIRTRIDANVLVLDAPDHPSLKTYRVASDEISAWLTSVLAVECYLACDPRLLLSSEASEHALASPDTLTESATATKSEPSPVLCPARRSELSFANESQILLVTSESSQKVAEWIAEEQGGDSGTAQANAAPVGPLQYRPNIVVKSAPSGSGPGRAIQPFEEFKWSSVSIGSTHLQVSGPCRHCQMIAVDQESAESLKEPYSVLARKMRIDGKVVFGIYLDNIDGAPNRMHRDSIATIQSGSLLSVAINDWQKLV